MTSKFAIIILLSGSVGLLAQTTGSADRVATPNAVIAPIRFTPMTQSQRLKLYLKNSFGPQSYLSSAAAAGLGQWKDRPKEWGQGGSAYGRRFLSSYAEHLTQTTLEYGLSNILREDNRYIPSGETEKSGRILYAIESPFLARRNDGTRRLSISHITSIVGAALISRTWQPHTDRGMRAAAINATTSMSVSMGFDVLREFWPRKKQ